MRQPDAYSDGPAGFDPLTSFVDVRRQRAQERREKIIEEILANRRGEYTVPTWVLAVCLVAMIAAVVAFLLLAG